MSPGRGVISRAGGVLTRKRKRYNPLSTSVFVGLFVILSGKVEVHISSQDGEAVLDSLAPGDVLGEIAALDGKSRMVAAAIRRLGSYKGWWT